MTKFTPEQELQICKEYESGDNALQISDKWLCCCGTIYNILRRNGYKVRTVSESNKGRKFSEETKKKLSENNIKRFEDNKYREKLGETISKAHLFGRNRREIYEEAKNLILQGFCGVEIAKILNVTSPSIYNWVKMYDDGDLLESLKLNGRIAKRVGGLKRKGKSSPLKGKTYEEIFGSREKANERAKITSDWMKTSRNIRRFCQIPSKPQKRLYNIIKERYPEAEVEYPLKLENKTLWLDIALPSLKIDIEYDGEYWHNLNGGDEERDKLLKGVDWQIIRVKDKELEKFIEKFQEGMISF